MPIRQVSITVENEPGRLNEICEILEYEQINIKAILAAARLSPVQLHMVVDDPEKAITILNSRGYITSTTEVLAVSVPDHPGGLNAVLKALFEARVNIETIYPFIKTAGEEAIMIMEVDDVLKAKDVIQKNWIKIHDAEIYKG